MSKFVEILPATKRHAYALAWHMRAADEAEVRALGMGPVEASVLSWRKSDFATTLKLGGEVAAVGGLILEPSSGVLDMRCGQVWLLTSKHVERAPMALHRLAKAWLAEAAQKVDVVWNYVDARYEASLRWLRALGFEVVDVPVRQPVTGIPFFLVRKRF